MDKSRDAARQLANFGSGDFGLPLATDDHKLINDDE